MTSDISLPFISRKRKNHIDIIPLTEKSFSAWFKKQKSHTLSQVMRLGFHGKKYQTCLVNDQNGEFEALLLGVEDTIGLYDFAHALRAVEDCIEPKLFKDYSFEISGKLKAGDLFKAHLGWGLAGYYFGQYKKEDKEKPALLWSKEADKKRVTAFLESVYTLRDLVNRPANDLGPNNLELAVKVMGKPYKASIKSIKGEALLKQNFPLIYTVGKAYEEQPRLIELEWGNKKHPALTLIGKGVTFDTGGLNIKPNQYMALMKKDMGGAAHALALANLVMAMKIPVHLRLLIPAVENSISASAFRPGDIMKSRKGLTIENINTDAEGRLILADSITYACEQKPELIIDFATLTGSARAALGPDIPGLFCNNEKTARDIEKIAIENEDPLWHMPLWKPYEKHLKSNAADMVNSVSIPGDLIYSALFLQNYLTDDYKGEWAHIDCFAWETSGRPGRPQGGADTGLLGIFAYLEKRYGTAK